MIEARALVYLQGIRIGMTFFSAEILAASRRVYW
jgi:hypothetical protein